MTEHDWLTSTNPQTMLRHLTHERVHAAGVGTVEVDRDPPLASDRKLRLFACACARMVWDSLTDDVECGRCGGAGRFKNHTKYWPSFCPDCNGTGRINRSRRAVEVAERFVDGLATARELDSVRVDSRDAMSGQAGKTLLAVYLASLAANSDETFEGCEICYNAVKLDIPAAALLRCIFGNPFVWNHIIGGWHSTVLAIAQTIYHERRFDHMPILADALEEAGCTNADIIDHLRGPGPHARGCHVLDLILGKE